MVEHMNAATAALPQSHSQSPNGSRHHRFSLLRWFRRRDSGSSSSRRKPKHQRRRASSSSSSSSSASGSSLDSFYSTATVRSFAFHSGTRKQAVDTALRLQTAAVGPFAPGAVKLAANGRVDVASTCTLPTGSAHRQDLQTRYALLPVNSFISYDNLSKPRDFARSAQQQRHKTAVGAGSNNDTLTSVGSSASGTRRVHVKGKRRAPEPPVPRVASANEVAAAAGSSRGRRKRRPAPQPPGHTSDTLSSEASAAGMDSLTVGNARDISNDTLVLRRGVLHPKQRDGHVLSRSASASVCDSDSSSAVLTPKLSGMMPRPWYKRNLFHDHGSRDSTGVRTNKGDVLRNLPTPQAVAEIKDENFSSTSNSPSLSSSFPFEGSLSRLPFFRHYSDDKKRDSKRKSGVSILTNISELDKEAAAIVQEEQARNRASMILQAAKLDEEFEKRMAANEAIVQEIVNSSLEKSPRRNSRALIGKFNGFNVNSGLFSRHSSASPKARRLSRRVDEAERDLSRYFPAKKPLPPKMESAAMFSEVISPARVPEVKPAQKAQSTNDNIAFAKTLAKELDDVATGIARLRRELDDRPKQLESAAKPRDESAKKTSTAADRQLANFDKEFTKIFDEIDRQLRPRDSRLVENAENNSASSTSTSAPKPSSSPKVVERIVDVVLDAKKEDKNDSSAANVTKNSSENTGDKGAKTKEASSSTTTSVVRISGVDDKTTNDLKEMLKEMKHSLPKRVPRPGTGGMQSDANKPSSSSTNKPTSTKVSSGVQTSGNVRRIVVKPSENTYANVNAQEPAQPRVKIDLRLADNAPPPAERAAAAAERPRDKSHDEAKLEEIKKQYMNTLAVNRLLRKLEAAIASGNHQQAALLAKELAQLKIHCSVVRQRSCNAAEKLNLSMYIEDKQAHQGPIPLQLPVNMTLAQLKAKIQLEFEIPANVQRWIIGKNLADDDEATLQDLQATDNSAIFLYLVAPPDLQDKEAIKADKEGEKQAERVINEKNDECEIKAEIKPEAAAAAAAAATATATAEARAAEPQARQEREESQSREEKLKRYEELMSLENCDVIVTAEPIECPVCLMFTFAGDGVILRDCLHSFCRDCVANTVRYCEEAEVKCPYRDADYTCESTLQEREIKALVTAEVYQQHLAKSIAQAENSAGNNAFHCKTPDCPGWCIYDDDVNNFLCPVCKVNNCLTCQAVHMGKNCRQYQEELKYSKETDHESKRTAAMLEEMVDRGEALPCPTCAVVLMKKWGCDWLRCSMCKTEICWVTRGPRWGPAGKGDTSGGCKCGENGIKCHPKCNYCH